MSLPHQRRVVTRHPFGVRLDEPGAGRDATSPVGLAR